MRAAGAVLPILLLGALDVAAAARAADLPPDSGPTEVTVVGPAGYTGSSASAFERAGAVQVACRQPAGDADVSVWIIATQRPEAFDMVLPQLQRSSRLDNDEMDDLSRRARDTAEGELVELGDDSQAAVARIDIEGAASGLLYVEDPAASPEQVHDLAEHLLSET